MSKSRDIADSAATINFIDTVTSNVQTQLNTLDTALDNISVTSGTLTKTFTNGESASISLTSSVLAPVVSVTKEVPQTGSTNNSWDVNSTTENYTRLDSAPATTLNWAVASNDIDLVTVASATLSGAAQSTSMHSGIMGNSGQNAYMVDNNTGIIYQYALSSAYDLSSGSYESKTLDVSAQQSDPRTFVFKPDGLSLYVTGTASAATYQYTLSVAWDISTATYASKSLSISAQATSAAGAAFKSDGTKIYVVSYSANAVYQYSLSTAWDISTASYDSVYLGVNSQDGTPRDIAFTNDGAIAYVSGSQNNKIYQYTLTTPWDLSSASYASKFFSVITTSVQYDSASLQITTFNAITDAMGSLNLKTSLALGTGSFPSADVGKTIEANSGVFVLTATSGSYVQTTAPTSYDQVASGSWEMYGVVYNTTDGDLQLSGYLGNGYDIASASYDSVSFSVASQDTLPNGLVFNSDGSKMFVVGRTGQDINEYALSTNFDVSSSTFTASFSVSSQGTEPAGIAFNTDGTKMFIAGAQSQHINYYTLSTGFNISTASANSGFNVAPYIPEGITFNNDGTKMYIATQNNNDIQQYNLSTGFDISTGQYNQRFDISAQDTASKGVRFNSDGTSMFVLGGTTDFVYKYELSTGFDISTASFASSFSIASQETIPAGLTFNSDGTKMYIVGYQNDTVFQYSSQAAFAATGYQPVHTTASTDTTYWTDINSMTADQAAGDGNVYYCISTDDRTTWTVIDNTDGERDIVRNNGGTWQYNSNGTYASETWVNGATNTELATIAESMEGAVATVGYALTNASFDSVSLAVSDNLTSIFFKPDGTKMYAIGYTNDTVYEYGLSTAFDLSTATLNGNTKNISAQSGYTPSLVFKSDGTKMYALGGGSVYQYSLSTAWDVSTASYESKSLTVSSQDSNSSGIWFKSDGTEMYMCGFTNDSIFQYDLSTAWDVSTGSYASVSFDMSATSTQPRNMYFDSTGAVLFVADTANPDKVFKFVLSTSWDITTISFSSSFDVSAQAAKAVGISLNANGTKMYVADSENTNTIYQYTTSSTAYPNQMDKTQLDAVTDPNHIALSNDFDLSIILNMTSGTTVPSSNGVAINYDANILNKGAVLGTDYDFDAPAQNKVRITAQAGNNLKVRVV